MADTDSKLGQGSPGNEAMKIVVALANMHNTLFISKAEEASSKSNPKSDGSYYFLIDKEIHDFMLSKFPLSHNDWTHIDLDTEL